MVNHTIEPLVRIRAREYAYRITQGEHGYTLANARLIYRKYYNYVVKYVKEYEIIDTATKSMLAARDYGNYLSYLEIALNRTLNVIGEFLESINSISKELIGATKAGDYNYAIMFTPYIKYAGSLKSLLLTTYEVVKGHSVYNVRETYFIVKSSLDDTLNMVKEFNKMTREMNWIYS